MIKAMPDVQQSQASIDTQSSQTLSDVLLSSHLISQEQFNDIKVKSASQAVSDETIIKSLNLVPEDKLSEAKAKLLGIPFISLESTSFSPQAISFLPRAVVERFALIPFMYDEKTNTLSIAMANPVDLEAL